MNRITSEWKVPGLVSWAKLCPRTIQSGTSLTAGKAGKGNPVGFLGLPGLVLFLVTIGAISVDLLTQAPPV